MPVVGTSVRPTFVTADHVRRFMRDYPDKNKLLDTVEFSEDDLNQALEFVTARYNALTPSSNMTSGQWPQHMQYALLQSISGYLLRSAAFQQLRNQVTYQDGDIAPIGVDDKFPLYMQMAQFLEDSAQQTLQQLKIQTNLEGMYGSLGSGYAWTGRRW